MSLKKLTAQEEKFERVLLYGDPKTAKTRLATSLTDRFGEILYYAADPGSEALSSVLPHYRSRINVIKSVSDGKTWDPDADAFNFALMDWSAEFPNVRTIVWDTMTATSLDLLSYVADTGQFSERKHIAIGSGQSSQNIPMQGDYMAVQNRVHRLLNALFSKRLHLVVVCHANYDEPREGGSVEGGPATVGKATIRAFPGRFDTVLFTNRSSKPPEKIGEPGKPTFAVYTERYRIWSAGIRSSHAINPMPKVELDPDPINFWKLYDKNFAKVVPAPTVPNPV